MGRSGGGCSLRVERLYKAEGGHPTAVFGEKGVGGGGQYVLLRSIQHASHYVYSVGAEGEGG